jgi:hypothetical protein
MYECIKWMHVSGFRFRLSLCTFQSENLLVVFHSFMLLSTSLSRALTLASTRCSWFSSHKSCGANWIPEQSAIAFPFSNVWNLRPEAPWIAVGALGLSLFNKDFAMGRIAWVLTSVLPIFVSHRSNAFLRVIRLITFVKQLTDVLYARSLVSCHSFLSLCLCINKQSKPRRSLFMSESVTSLVDSLHAEATEAVKSRDE